MTISYEAKDYSRGRASAMGVATALILWFHADITVPSDVGQFLKTICDIGVDMFLLASGVGIWFAVGKYDSYGAYLVNRLRRILPAFLCACVPWYAYQVWGLGNGDTATFLKQVTTLSFWLDDDWSCWFVPAILVLYVATPPVLRAWKRWNWVGIVSFVGAVAFAMAVQHTVLIVPLGSQLIFIGRIPAYILGLHLGKAIEEERVFRISIPLTLAVLGGSILAMLSCCGYLSVQLPWIYRYFAYLPVMLCLSLVCAKLPHSRWLQGIGAVSLECYLLFEKIQMGLQSQRWMWPLMERSDIFRPVVAVFMTLLAAPVLQWICKGKWLTGRVLDKTALER